MSAKTTKNNNNHTQHSQQQQPVNLSRKRSRAQFRDSNNSKDSDFQFDEPLPIHKNTKTLRSKRQITTQQKPNQDQVVQIKKQRAKSMGGQALSKQQQSQKQQDNPKSSLIKQSNLQDFFKANKKCKNTQCDKQTPSKAVDLIKCEFCCDHYHWQCSQQFEQIPTQSDEFICNSCLTQLKETKRSKKNKASHFAYIEKSCSQCKKEFTVESETKNCTKCQSEFHQSCFEKFDDDMFCLKCQNKLKNDNIQRIPDLKIPLIYQSQQASIHSSKKSQKNIPLTNFFKQTKSKQETENLFTDILQKSDQAQSQLIDQFLSQDLMKKQPRKKSVSLTRKKKVFKLPKLAEDPITEQEIRQSFERAFFAKDLQYTTKPVYDHPQCPESFNNINNEPNVQKLIKENIDVVQQLRRREELGILPPLILKHDSVCSFYVEAAQDLPDLTLLCEYAGEVRTTRQTIFDQNDSIMELLDTGDSDTSLVIAPLKYSNVGRFFNSINKNSKDSKKKQNIMSIRCQIDGKATVMIYTKRNVKKGEQLLYDYNEAKNMYPTDDFV